MINVMKYASPRAKELPQDFIDDIISVLNAHQILLTEATKHREDGHWGELQYDTVRRNLNDFINFLDILDLHPVWDMPGHRGTYYFPSESDCEMWKDYIYQCVEY